MLTRGGDGHAVHRQHTALFREHPGKVGVIVDHGDGVAGVVHADSCLTADHFIKDLIHDIGLHQRLLSLELFHHLVHFFRGLGVDVMAALEGRNGVGVAAVVEHQDVAGILFIPQVRPTGGCLVHHRGVVDDAGGAQHVGHRIGVLGVVIRVAVFRVDLLEVGDVVVVEGLEHPFCDHLGHHVVRGNHHIVVRRAGFQFGVHGLVGIEGGVVHLDAGQVLKGGHHVQAVVRAVGDVLTPVVDVQSHVLALEAGPVVIAGHRNVLIHLNGVCRKGRQRAAHCQRQREQQNGKTFHHTPSPLSAFWSRR